MCASRHVVSSDPRLSFRQARREDLNNAGLLSQYFVSACSGIGRDIEATAMRALLAAGNDPARLEIFAEGSDGSIGCLVLEHKPWDSAMISAPARCVTLLAAAPGSGSRYRIASGLLGKWLHNNSKASDGMVTTRIPADDTPLFHALEDDGFRALVPMVTLGKTIGEMEVALPAGIDIFVAQPQDYDAVESIAETAFPWGRFSVDPAMPGGAAEKVHRAWARNCCLGMQAKHVLVARGKHDVLGFIALKFQTAGALEVGAIELLATREAARGIGIGRALVQAGCNWLSSATNHAVVRTELPNTSAIRLYESQGFRVLNGSLYLSRWSYLEQ